NGKHVLIVEDIIDSGLTLSWLLENFGSRGAEWEFWGVAEAAIINGEDPATTWQKLVDDVTAAIK
uniref:phosphoribosyltransferase family protein n=1 Tax=Microbacterium sp. BF1 TaxID=2821146 RepID=UPI0035AC1A98